MSYDSFEYESPISVKPDRNIRTRKHFSFCGCLLGVAVGGVVAGGAVAVVMWYMFGNYNCQTNDDSIPLSLKQNSSTEEISHESNLVYKGESDFSGLRSGYGFQVFPNGRIAYAGKWRKNLRDGDGSEFYPDGVLKFRGQWVAGKKTGPGQMFAQNGTLVFDGHFKDDVKDGNGTQFIDGKPYYIGQFVNGVKIGHGIVIYEDDLKHYYDGFWKDNLLHGMGKLVAPTYTYEGEWKNNKMDGRGILVFNDGDFYKGTFKENHFDGRGCYYSAKAGHIFIGHYTNHHKNGLGMYYYKNDDRLKCTWINGEKNGFCKHYRGNEVCEELFENGVKKKDAGRCWPNNEAKEENLKNCLDYNFEH